MNKILIKGGSVVLPDKIVKTDILAEDGKIIGIKENITADCEVIDATDCYVTPGIVELHTHGAGGSDFCDGTVEAFENVIKSHIEHGVTYVCPTLMSCSLEDMLKAFEIYRKAKCGKYGKHISKLHLEGPYLSPEMAGAQRGDIIRCPKKEEVDKIFEVAGDIIGRISCAPEIEGIDYLAKRAKENNILLSIGHSSAMADDVRCAMEKGFNHITHLYSATTTVKKINQRVRAGILEASYLYDDIYIELIADGRHVAKETMQMALKIKGSDKINLTSDSMRASGQTGISESYLGNICPENRVVIDDGVAKLPDLSFYAGSIATGERMMNNAIMNYDIPIVDAVKMLSTTPAKIMGFDNKGEISIGKDADLVIWDKEFKLKKVIC